MYPAWPDTDVDAHGIATLPDGRKVRIHQTGYVEGDTNAFVDEDLKLWWVESGDELTNEEINAEIEHEGRKFYLHEYVSEFAEWEA